MAWDSSRPVPWKPLARMYAIYAVIAMAVLALMRRSFDASVVTGVVFGGVFWFAIMAVAVKMGFDPLTRFRFKRPDAPAPREEAGSRPASSDAASAERAKPAPT